MSDQDDPERENKTWFEISNKGGFFKTLFQIGETGSPGTLPGTLVHNYIIIKKRGKLGNVKSVLATLIGS